MLGREHHGSIARVDAGILDMLTDGIFYNLTLVGHGIKLYLLGVLHELAHHDRIVL